MKLSTQDMLSIMESALFSLNHPLSLQDFSKLFYAEKAPVSKIKKALSLLKNKYEEEGSGLRLIESAGLYSIHTKEENKDYIRRLKKGRMFQLSAPAMEVLAIVAYKQPCRKAQVDEIRGVESGHLLKTLMEKNLINFGPKSELPGKPMTYKTTKNFLEVFDLKNLKSLPSPDDIADLLPAGAEEEPAEAEDLKTVLQEFASPKTSAEEKEALERELKDVSQNIKDVSTKVEWNLESEFQEP